MGRLASLLCHTALAAARGVAAPNDRPSEARSFDANGIDCCASRFLPTSDGDLRAREKAEGLRLETLSASIGTTQRVTPDPAPRFKAPNRTGQSFGGDTR